MKLNSLAPLALVMAVSACGGDSLRPDVVAGGSTTAPPTDTAIVIPDALKYNLKTAVIVPGENGAADTLLVAISALDTTPVNASWQLEPSLDIPGYRAFKRQEDPLDRLFIGLAASSADKSVRAVVAGDGGQFNRVFSGAIYDRKDGYTPPPATASGPGTGQVSYKGKYAGLLNGGSVGTALLPIPPGRPTAATEAPKQAARVQGDVFMNANFADNVVNGIVKNRKVVDLAITNDPSSAVYDSGSGVELQNVVLVKSDIIANGTFTGTAEREVVKTKVGTYGGVVGGANGSSIAGALQLDTIYDKIGTPITDALERGVFVLDQCGLTATAGGDCLGTAP